MEQFPKKQEKIEVRIEIATEKDWQAYKEIRLEAIKGKDAAMFGGHDKERDKVKPDDEWREDLALHEDRFIILSWVGSRAAGMGRADEIKDKKGVWSMGQGYVRDEFRGENIGKKILAARLAEIKKRGGVKVITAMFHGNERPMHIAGLFGFKKIGTLRQLVRGRDLTPLKLRRMELDLTDPEVIKKIDA